MDNIRLMLIMALIFVLLLIYQAWQEDYGPKPTVVEPPRASTPAPDTPATTASALPDTTNNDIPTAPPSDASLPNTSSVLPKVSFSSVLQEEQRVIVETDVMIVEIDTMGGDLRRKFLLDYPVSVQNSSPFQLMNDKLPNLFVAQSGLLPADTAPNHLTVYQAEKTHYQLDATGDTLTVPLQWTNAQGIRVVKSFIFTRGSHVIKVIHHVYNGSEQPWLVRQYAQFQRTQVAEEGQSSFIYTYMGGAISSPKQLYEKITFENLAENKLNPEARGSWAGGWAAMLQHYFVAAWVPPREEQFSYFGRMLTEGKRYMLGLYGPTTSVAAGGEHQFELQLYAGPKIQDQLAALAPGLDLTVDYGWLWFIAQPLFWLLGAIYHLIGNWGMAIILVTLLIKLAFFHLSATSYKSMANMRRLQPRLIALKDRYGDDRTKLNQAMMDLYKKEKINPLSGCLPILIQIPVFIALYWVLLESVELRQADFLWLTDLSRPDPYFILPLVMGVTMLIQQKLNPAPLDPMQQKIMMILPIVFTVFFAFFPSGLVLYWVVNNVLSIAQQWVITKKIAGDVSLTN
ncbi:membrane protein insertase YidC [Thioflexithrix psekupsensis]|uniref:Membrane protein insertase YidC n=1 Tax=Thioflexithrix psekupsensis TaxID=1570016 RepID=A0A251X6H6_9GAMM|nr:membrane protein insertase YidC [Thioflexithrix psekupsensis]OUD13238.1 membrane protein insertase YidC [Thioflexithrix psekupsensis]